MRSRRSVIVCAAITAFAAPSAFAAPGDVNRASVTNAGAQSTTGGFRGVVSGDGRYVVFVSAEDLTGVPTGGKLQAYRRDLRDGRTQLVSTSSAGAVANQNVEAGDPFNPFIDVTPDGRYIVFRSAATNLVATDTNAQDDVFRKDMGTGEIQMVSVSSAGAQGNNFSSDPSISGDGSRVVFVTAATNLATPDGNNAASDVLMRDFVVGTTTLVSSNSAGQQANEFTERPSISADGRVVAFEAGPLTTNLYADDANAANDIIVKNLVTGVAVPAAVITTATTLGGADVKGGSAPDISGDGRYVVFQTGEQLDAANDVNAATDVYRRDVVAGVTTAASARNTLPTAEGGSTGTISADGTRVGFTSISANLVVGDANAPNDAFARTVASRETVRMSQLANGTEAILGWETTGLSGNGARGVFTGQGRFSVDDSNAADDVYTKELVPTDAAGPVLSGAGVGTSATVARVSGSVSDPSAVARLTVAGSLVRPGVDGTFAIDVARSPTGLTTVPVEAMDGAGNLSTLTVTVASALMAPRITKTTVAVTRRQVIARFRLSQPARVVGILQRRVVGRAGKVRFVQVGSARIANRKPGTRQVVFPRPTRPGVYRVRLSAKNAAGKHVVIRRVVIARAR